MAFLMVKLFCPVVHETFTEIPEEGHL